MSNKVEVYQRPILLSVNVLYRVCQYLRGDVPLGYLRDWQVDLWLNCQMCNSADAFFLQRFEGLHFEYGMYKKMRLEANDGKPDDSEDIFKRELHELIGALPTNLEPTGSPNQVLEVTR